MCRRLVDLSLKEGYEPGMTAKALFGYYKSFGDDPFIVTIEGSDESAKFSAWDYARERCRSMAMGQSTKTTQSRRNSAGLIPAPGRRSGSLDRGELASVPLYSVGWHPINTTMPRPTGASSILTRPARVTAY